MIELIRSDVILGRVIDRLELDERSGKLDERWGKRNLGLKLTKAQAMVLLRRRLDVRLSEGGTLIQVGVFGKRPEEPEEAMDIANTIAEELRAFRIEQHDSPADMLEMTLRFTPPYFLLGSAAAFVLGLLAGGLVLLFAFLRRGSQASQVKNGVETIVGSAGDPPAEPGVSPATESAEGHAPSRPLSASETAGLENARTQVKGPATGLLVVGIVTWLEPRWSFSLFCSWASGPRRAPPACQTLSRARCCQYRRSPIGRVPAVLSTLMIVAALKMKRLRAYGLDTTASILAIISPSLPDRPADWRLGVGGAQPPRSPGTPSSKEQRHARRHAIGSEPNYQHCCAAGGGKAKGDSAETMINLLNLTETTQARHLAGQSLQAVSPD